MPGAMPGTGETVTSQTGDGSCLRGASGSPAEGRGEINPPKNHANGHVIANPDEYTYRRRVW